MLRRAQTELSRPHLPTMAAGCKIPTPHQLNGWPLAMEDPLQRNPRNHTQDSTLRKHRLPLTNRVLLCPGRRSFARPSRRPKPFSINMRNSLGLASWLLLHTSIPVSQDDSPVGLTCLTTTGNYATDVAAGASFRFALLFVILMSNIFAIFLQSLSVKLGTVTGKNLAENSREHLPKWLNVTIYVLAEVAIVATDVAEVSVMHRFLTFQLVDGLTNM